MTRLAGAALALLVAGGCEGSARIAGGDTAAAAGGHALLSMNGQALPIDLGEFVFPPPPSPGGSPPGGPCRRTLAEGWLGLDRALERFVLQQVTRVSCGRVGPMVESDIGSYMQVGDVLVFTPEGGRGAFSGVLRDGNIVVVRAADTLVFAGRAVLPLDPAGMSLRLISADGLALPAAGSDRGGGCRADLAEGTVQFTRTLSVPYSLGMTSGSFVLESRYVNSCTGETFRSERETGFYENAGSGIYLQGQIAPNIVHPFWGILRPDGAELFYNGDLVFQR